jgi:hypothetical protein
LADVSVVIISPLGADREGDSVNCADGGGIAAESAILPLGQNFDSNLKCFFIGHSTGFSVSMQA